MNKDYDFNTGRIKRRCCTISCDKCMKEIEVTSSMMNTNVLHFRRETFTLCKECGDELYRTFHKMRNLEASITKMKIDLYKKDKEGAE